MRLRMVLTDFKDECGQSTVEFVDVLSGILVVILGLGAMLRFGDEGLLVGHAIMSASHNISGAVLGIAGDVFCF